MSKINHQIVSRLELEIGYAMAQACAAKSGARYAAWYDVAGKLHDALRDYRAGFVDAATRALKNAREAAAFAEVVK